MEKSEMIARLSWALETAADEGFIDSVAGLPALLDNQYTILRYEFDEDEIDEIPESLIKSVFKSWVNDN